MQRHQTSQNDKTDASQLIERAQAQEVNEYYGTNHEM